MSEEKHNPDCKCSFEEYKLMYESAEKVTERRTNLNKSNYATCIALVVASAVVANWTIDRQGVYLNLGVCVVSMFGLLGILFCTGWIKQITDLKNLNSAKFQVMEEMAENMEFSGGYHSSLASFQPFKREWDIMSAKEGALTKFGIGKALSGTNVEYFVPRAFIVVFFLTMLLAPITLYTDILP